MKIHDTPSPNQPPSTSDPQEAKDKPNRRYLALNSKPVSIEAQTFTRALTARIAIVMGVGATKTLDRAVGALLGDLMALLSYGPDAYCFRSVGLATFTGQPVGYRPFTSALNGLLRLALIDRTLGVYRSNGTSKASTFRPSRLLLDEVERSGIGTGEWHYHFAYLPRPTAVPNPILLRAARHSWQMEEKGKAMIIDWANPMPMVAKEQVNRLNTFFASVIIEGAPHHGFQRIYGNGDDPKFNWDMGGRLYSLGFRLVQSQKARAVARATPERKFAASLS